MEYGILIVACVILIFFTLSLNNQNKKLKQKIKKDESRNTNIQKALDELKKPLRKDYYKHPLSITSNKPEHNGHKFDAIIYVEEIDKYTNGESSIRLKRINPGCPETMMPKHEVEEFLESTFEEIVKTNFVTWLESEVNVKEMRKDKLKQLKDSIEDGSI